jgi:branched-chain amino acid transport system substrate-binding protein
MNTKSIHQKKSSFRIMILLILFVFISCTPQDKPPIKIGLSVNLSGRGGAAGEHIRDGALLAVDEINEAGGIRGRPIKLLVRDDQNSTQGIKRADQSLLNEGVVAIIGHSYSSNTVKAFPLVTSNNTLLITAYSATTILSRKDDLFLRTSVDCALYGRKMAALLKKYSITSIAVLMDMTNSAFVEDFLKYLKKNFTGKLIQVSFNSRKNADWQKLTASLLDSQSQAVVFLTEASMTGIGLQKLTNRHYQGRYFATLWTQTPELFRIAGPAAQGLSIITFIDPGNQRPGYQAFDRKMKKKFHKPATARSARAHEIITVLADAMARCPQINALELKKALLTGEYESIMGHLKFNSFGDVVRPVYEVKVQDGKFVYNGRI